MPEEDSNFRHADYDSTALRRNLILEEFDGLPVVILEGGWSRQRASRALVDVTPLG
jgi:hypothetical protein